MYKDPRLHTHDGIEWYHTVKCWGPNAITYKDLRSWQKLTASDNCNGCATYIRNGEEVYTQNSPAYLKTLCMACVRRRGYIW